MLIRAVKHHLAVHKFNPGMDCSLALVDSPIEFDRAMTETDIVGIKMAFLEEKVGVRLKAVALFHFTPPPFRVIP